MTLREPVDIPSRDQMGHLHFIAIGGAGMSGIASFYHQIGMKVSGCDRSDSEVTARLVDSGIPVQIGHDPSHLDGVDTVVISTAIRADNSELCEAKRRHIPILHRSVALAALMDSRTVAIAGSHGKTTTSAMTVAALRAGSLDPSYVIGAPLADSKESSACASRDLFVIEADESDGSFLQYPAQIAVVTSVEADHLDNWESAENYMQGFVRFATADPIETVVVNIDHAGGRQLAERIASSNKSVITYGQSHDAAWRIEDIVSQRTSSTAYLVCPEGRYEMTIPMPGRYNVANAVAAAIVARLNQVEWEDLLEGLASFKGTSRRFQKIDEITCDGWEESIAIFDDYAHHPAEISAALEAARPIANGGKLIACFQPHLFTRTRDFAEDFGKALTAADQIVITDIYPAREDPIEGVTSHLVVQAARRYVDDKKVIYCPKADMAQTVAALARPGDCVMILGAGDITYEADKVAKAIRKVCCER